jgi:hypothetical protein
MSIRITRLVRDKFPSGGNDLLTMLILSMYADDHGGNIYPSKETLAKDLRCTKRQARRNVSKLVSEGFLIEVANKFGGAKGSTTRYQINLTKLQATGDRNVLPDDGVTGDIFGTGGGTFLVTRGDMDVRQVVKNSQLIVRGKKDSHSKPTVNKKTKLPDDWILPEDWKKAALAEQPNLDVNTVSKKFKFHFRNSDPKSDWFGEWMKWVLNERITPATKTESYSPLDEQGTGAFSSEAVAEREAQREKERRNREMGLGANDYVA